MRKTAIILNPAARSERAGGLGAEIESLVGASATLLRTSRQGEARALARQAVEAGFEQIIAAGGDGTINEVVNGIAGSDSALGLLPTGTMNVFATELGVPRNLREGWAVIRAGAEREIDLPLANGHAFVQLAGVGLDAQVVQETSWTSKKTLGPLSYLISAAQIAARKPPRLLVQSAGASGEAFTEGSFVLIGNGRFYGGPFPVFTDARIDDGLLDVLIFKNLGYLDIARYLHGIAFGKHLRMRDVEHLKTASLTVSCDEAVPVEVDGEVIGSVPVEFRFHPKRLRVLAPPQPQP